MKSSIAIFMFELDAYSRHLFVSIVFIQENTDFT